MGKILLKNSEEDKVAGKHTRRKTELGWRNGKNKKRKKKKIEKKKNKNTRSVV